MNRRKASAVAVLLQPYIEGPEDRALEAQLDALRLVPEEPAEILQVRAADVLAAPGPDFDSVLSIEREAAAS